MQGLLSKVKGLSRFLNIIAGISLIFLMSLTMADVVLRFFKRPLVGTYELVAYSGALVIGFSIPFTSWVRGHIYVDFLILKLSSTSRKIFHIFTRCLGMGLFLSVGWNLIKMGMDLHRSGEVSPTLQMPFYPIVYAVGFCCFIQFLVLLSDVLKIFEGQYE
jgi:TRAP-type C4-dicarboxylate transport system permease small subunit